MRSCVTSSKPRDCCAGSSKGKGVPAEGGSRPRGTPRSGSGPFPRGPTRDDVLQGVGPDAVGGLRLPRCVGLNTDTGARLRHPPSVGFSARVLGGRFGPLRARARRDHGWIWRPPPGARAVAAHRDLAAGLAGQRSVSTMVIGERPVDARPRASAEPRPRRICRCGAVTPPSGALRPPSSSCAGLERRRPAFARTHPAAGCMHPCARRRDGGLSCPCLAEGGACQVSWYSRRQRSCFRLLLPARSSPPRQHPRHHRSGPTPSW